MGNELDLGKKVWYKCPICEEEKWALESFVDSPCWQCLGNQQIADDTNKIVKESDPDFFNRRDKFMTMPENGKPFHPKSTYKYSNFRVLYKQICADDISDDMILKILQQEVPSLVSTYKYCDYNSVSKKCVKLWTEPSPLYRKFTKMLIYDNYADLKKFMPIIRGITSHLVSPTDRKMTTYRGSKILMKQFDQIKIGTTYRIPQILATSESKNTAQSFLEGDGVMVEFSIPKGCWNASPIAQFSAISSEEEVLFPPYTAIKINSKKK
eukprot:111145_1